MPGRLIAAFAVMVFTANVASAQCKTCIGGKCFQTSCNVSVEASPILTVQPYEPVRNVGRVAVNTVNYVRPVRRTVRYFRTCKPVRRLLFGRCCR